MPACEIDAEASPTYKRLLKQLRKKYRHIEDDVKAAFTEIQIDYETKQHATPIPGYNRTLWKHRCVCRDLQSGKSGGIRIISRLVEKGTVHRLYPILIYVKSESEDASPAEIGDAIKQLDAALAESATA